MEKSVGSIVVSTDGDVLLLTELEVVSEVPGVRNGHWDVTLYDVGIFLRGEQPVGKKAFIPRDEPVRVVANVSDVLRLLEHSFVDLSPARK
jgi:hypothetical protein